GNCEAFECLSLQSEAIFSGGISRSKVIIICVSSCTGILSLSL
ncbi:unnamed protein product, partial [Brassica oleracea]